MTIRLRLVASAMVVIGLGCPPPARAHRLDEYLQATLLSIERERVGVEIALTAGATIAPAIFGSIDADRDGRISELEGDAYAQGVLRAVLLSVDNRPARFTLESARFPAFEDMRLGLGTIHVRAGADIPSATSGNHRLFYRNEYQPAGSVYLVNALVPADRAIQVGGQLRDVLQHSVDIEYRVARDARVAGAGWVLVCVAMIGLLTLRRPARQIR